MPTILVKCAKRHNTTTVFYYRHTYIAQIGFVVLNSLSIWAISVSTLPLAASILLIILSFSLLSQLVFRFGHQAISPELFHPLIRIDRQLSEFGLQLLLKNGQVLRLMRYQFESDEYKKFNVVLDEGVNNLSICVLSSKKRQDKK
ncbi:hypothetical protein [Vibrio sp. CK2-1]|uniref:hypothetical protein n=1 Tax=Vibrio sp. CK2-1 TaxID=2912249 RepID=UPI001F377423|nr:hypothetical protein [Vibrio sp. CK2-1]MCF7353927.1 hypothetical protein [Vibrio sp. CK2-1]